MPPPPLSLSPSVATPIQSGVMREWCGRKRFGTKPVNQRGGGPGATDARVVRSEQVVEVWECLLGPLTFVTEASYNPVLKDHTDIIESPWMELNGDH